MVALFTFLAGVPVLSWVSVLTVGHDAALAGYALVVPVMAGLSHAYSTVLLPRLQKVPSPGG